MRKNNRKRDKSGRYIRDLTLYRLFLVALTVMFVIAVSFVGLNNLWNWIMSFNRVIEVQNAYAKMTWQEEVVGLLKHGGVDSEYASKVIACESSWNPDAVHYNRKGQGVDRGLWQINNIHHPEVQKECAENYRCATMAAIKIIKEKGFAEWSCNKLIK